MHAWLRRMDACSAFTIMNNKRRTSAYRTRDPGLAVAHEQRLCIIRPEHRVMEQALQRKDGLRGTLIRESTLLLLVPTETVCSVQAARNWEGSCPTTCQGSADSNTALSASMQGDAMRWHQQHGNMRRGPTAHMEACIVGLVAHRHPHYRAQRPFQDASRMKRVHACHS